MGENAHRLTIPAGIVLDRGSNASSSKEKKNSSLSSSLFYRSARWADQEGEIVAQGQTLSPNTKQPDVIQMMEIQDAVYNHGHILRNINRITSTKSNATPKSNDYKVHKVTLSQE